MIGGTIAPQPPKEKKQGLRKEPEPLLGRGGQQHKYLQDIIKRLAEDKGYKATIEKPILNGLGSVDVALEKKVRSIACEVSVTSTPGYELSNIENRLAANFSHVVLVSTQEPFLSKMKKRATENIGPADMRRVHFFLPEELISFIDDLDAADVDSEQTVRGYRVKVKRKVLSTEERKRRERRLEKPSLMH